MAAFFNVFPALSQSVLKGIFWVRMQGILCYFVCGVRVGTNRFAALENLSDDENVNRTWWNIKGNIQTSAKESLGLHVLKQHKHWFDEECLGFLDQRNWAKIQWIQDPNQNSVDNLNSEVSRHFRNKKKAYPRAKIEELETNSKIMNIRDLYRGINDFKKGY